MSVLSRKPKPAPTVSVAAMTAATEFGGQDVLPSEGIVVATQDFAVTWAPYRGVVRAGQRFAVHHVIVEHFPDNFRKPEPESGPDAA